MSMKRTSVTPGFYYNDYYMNSGWNGGNGAPYQSSSSAYFPPQPINTIGTSGGGPPPGMPPPPPMGDPMMGEGSAAKKPKTATGALLELCNQVIDVGSRRRQLEAELAQVKQLELGLVSRLHSMALQYDGEAEDVSGLLSTALGERAPIFPPKPVDTSQHHHIYVGNLAPMVDEMGLRRMFSSVGTVSSANVVRDPESGGSKGFGFCSFPTREEADQAIQRMNGQWYMGKQLRLNWSTKKPNASGRLEFADGVEVPKMPREAIVAQTDDENSTIYIGSLTPTTTDAEIREVFGTFGTITNSRVLHRENFSYAFLRFDKKDEAVNAIHDMNGSSLNGTTIRVSWGKPLELVQPKSGAQPDDGISFGIA